MSSNQGWIALIVQIIVILLLLLASILYGAWRWYRLKKARLAAITAAIQPKESLMLPAPPTIALPIEVTPKTARSSLMTPKSTTKAASARAGVTKTATQSSVKAPIATKTEDAKPQSHEQTPKEKTPTPVIVSAECGIVPPSYAPKVPTPPLRPSTAAKTGAAAGKKKTSRALSPQWDVKTAKSGIGSVALSLEISETEQPTQAPMPTTSQYNTTIGTVTNTTMTSIPDKTQAEKPRTPPFGDATQRPQSTTTIANPAEDIQADQPDKTQRQLVDD